MLRPLTAAAALSALIACGDKDPDEEADAKPEPIPPPAVEVSEAVIQGTTDFGFSFHRMLAQDDDNHFHSPLSVQLALGMTWAGARGETESQMRDTLQFSLSQEELHPALGALQTSLRKGSDGVQVQLANRLWGAADATFQEAFLATTRDAYGAELQTLDFSDPAASNTINAWISQQTVQRIPELIAPDVLDGNTRLVLTNAIAFTGTWATQFDPSVTNAAPFTRLDGSTVDAEMMVMKGELEYARSGEVKVVRLPYAGDQHEMVLLVPTEVDGVQALEEGLSAAQLDTWLAETARTEILLTLPRFSLRSDYSLAPALSGMGMRDAFTPAADFSGMTGDTSLAISAVLHQAMVEVDEEGTVAAAATAVVMTRKAAPMPPPVVRCDRPFVFLIRDTETGAILFMGRLANPSG